MIVHDVVCEPMEGTMKVRLLLTIALFTFAAGTPQAQVTIDVAKLTCEQLYMEKLAWPSKYAVLWLNGYFHGKRSNTIIDPAVMEQDEEKVNSYCSKNPKMTVMNAVNELGLDK
jgi:acid stress chaperone HdeB